MYIDKDVSRSNVRFVPRAIPEPTLKRLPLYHRLLKELPAQAGPAISCTEIGRKLHLQPTQVRKDLALAGLTGKPRVGYPIAETIDGIASFLGWEKVNEAILVGVGSLGSALLGYRKFEQCGLRIVAAFDEDPVKFGTRIHGIPVLEWQMLPEFVRRMGVLIGIITVPPAEAQTVADHMVAGGIRAIWNFAPVKLTTPDTVIIHNEDLYCSLAALSQKLSRELGVRPAKPAAAWDRAHAEKMLA